MKEGIHRHHHRPNSTSSLMILSSAHGYGPAIGYEKTNQIDVVGSNSGGEVPKDPQELVMYGLGSDANRLPHSLPCVGSILNEQLWLPLCLIHPRYNKISRNLAMEYHPADSLKALRGVTCRPLCPQLRQKRHILRAPEFSKAETRCSPRIRMQSRKTRY